MSDISHLLAVINRIVDNANTVIVIEHNGDILKNADWIIDEEIAYWRVLA